MRYDLSKLPLKILLQPVSTATGELARLDERINHSDIRAGWRERSDFADAVASLWVDGELVHLEDLVLHDCGMGIRAPTHELTIAHDVLRTRRRILSNSADWALSAQGIRSLTSGGGEWERAPEVKRAPPEREEPETPLEQDPLAAELAAMDAVLARAEAVLSGTLAPGKERETRDPLVYQDDWDEADRLAEWQAALQETEGLPPVLRAALMLDAWNELQVLQHAPWLGRLLTSALLRQSGLTAAHLVSLNLGLKSIPFERRRSRDRNTRLLATLEALILAGENGLRTHNRLVLARQQMQRKLEGRRSSSRLPQLIDLVLSKPLVSAGMIAAALDITPQGALRIAAELNLRELTGRGRFRAWGVL